MAMLRIRTKPFIAITASCSPQRVLNGFMKIDRVLIGMTKILNSLASCVYLAGIKCSLSMPAITKIDSVAETIVAPINMLSSLASLLFSTQPLNRYGKFNAEGGVTPRRTSIPSRRWRRNTLDRFLLSLN